MRASLSMFLVAALAGLAGCGPSSLTDGEDAALEGLALTSLSPRTVVPGSRLVVSGRSFVDSAFGESRLWLRGNLDGRPVDIRLPVVWEDFDTLSLGWTAELLGADQGRFQGEALVEVESVVDGDTYVSDPLPVEIDVRPNLEPRLDEIATGVIFVNEPIVVEGEGLLLGGDEGRTVAVVEGCFTLEGGGACVPVGPYSAPVTPDSAFDRTRGTFPFDPRIAGIEPGRFDGTVVLRNEHGARADLVTLDGAPETVLYDMVPPQVFQIAPATVSIGQYVDIQGGGFIGVPSGGTDAGLMTTVIELSGSYRPTGTTVDVPVTLALVPEFVAGPLVRYVVNEQDQLGQATNIREASGTFTGTVVPVTTFDGDTVRGDPRNVSLNLRPARQVIWINFEPGYVESLRHFGLRAMDPVIRRRVLDVARRDFAGVGVELRTESPEDWALFSRVDISGPDPNGMGLLGYDNTPGKDVNNQRLNDKIGGVNATTQEEGFPGFGGVFVESFFGFSTHPNRLAKKLGGADPLFDQIFDPFRPDEGNRPVRLADIEGDQVPYLTSAASCPGDDRSMQIACATWVLGSMIGNTMTHELGHSLGLANPFGEGFHNVGDKPNRLMDAGGARPFPERAEIGLGPAVFCEEEYEYLRDILPSDESPPAVTRPACF